MRRHSCRLLGAAIIAIALVAGGCGSEQSDSSTGRGGVDGAALDAALAEAGIDPAGPGCAAAVGTDRGVVWSGGQGLADLEDGTAIDDRTVFDIGSTSKQFTATAVLLLDAEGDVSLEDPLAEWVPGLPGWAGTVTIGQLMRHTSGVPDYIDLLADLGVGELDPASTADALAVIADADELDRSPGTEFSYSNSNYVLLAEVVEAASGLGLGSFVDQEVFSPLGLDAVLDPLARPEGRATSYTDSGDGYEVADSPWTQVGDGAVQTTPSELVVWAREYWAPVLGGSELLAARLDDAVPDPESGGAYGAGIEAFEAEGGPVLSHGGAWSGFVTDLVIRPDERIAAAVSCNAPDVADPTGLAERLLDAL